MTDTVASDALVSDNSSPSPSQKSTHLRTVNALLEGYNSLSVRHLLQPLAPTFVHRVLPTTLNMPARDKDAFAQHARGVFSVFRQFRMIPVEIYEDPVEGVVVVYARMEGTIKAGRQAWRNECILIVKLSEDGREVLEVDEFVDSLKAVEMKARHAPKEFGAETGRRGMFGVGWAGGLLLFTCLAGGTMFGVRRYLLRD